MNYAVAVSSIKPFLQRPERVVEAPRVTPRQEAAPRTERYGNIVGMYINAQAPPPDSWFVYTNSGELAYAVTGSRIPTLIDMVLVGADPDWRSIVYAIDSNCDGIIDLLGLDSNGDDVIDRYGRPTQPVRLASRAPEFAQALMRGAIPYREVRLCATRR